MEEIKEIQRNENLVRFLNTIVEVMEKSESKTEIRINTKLLLYLFQDKHDYVSN